MPGKSIEIICIECGTDTILKREPIYDGFNKTGESLSCLSCGHEYASEEEVPYKTKKVIDIFTEDEKPQVLDIFNDEEKGRNCRHCVHYVVNPFKQRCDLHDKEVQATDLCFDFEGKVKDASDGSESDSSDTSSGESEE
jgi:hypothetical protein